MNGVYYQINKMQCLQIGEGKKFLFAFHGFGQSPKAFEKLEILLPEYTIFSFDILSFGKEPKKENFCEQISVFCQQHGILIFSVLAFSIGARMALSLLESCPEKIEKTYLIAPDGFQKNYWYQLAVSPLGKLAFWRFIKKPLFFLKIAQMLTHAGLLHQELYLLAEKYSNTPPKRFLLWRTWLSHKHLMPNLKILHHVLGQKPIPIVILLAHQDLLTPSLSVQKFATTHPCIHVKHSSYKHHQILREALQDKELLSFFQS